jgi:hypothetical protein
VALAEHVGRLGSFGFRDWRRSLLWNGGCVCMVNAGRVVDQPVKFLVRDISATCGARQAPRESFRFLTTGKL